MRILWDCRSFARHMGGIAHATAGWLRAFVTQRAKDWHVALIHSSMCEKDTLQRIVPELDGSVEIHEVQAGFIAPRFEQLQLPVLLERWAIDLYFNPGFTLPAIKTTRFQVAVIHDVVFFDHPQWVSPQLQRIFTSATDLVMKRADDVFTVSDFSRTRLTAMARQRGWERADRIKLLRPAVSHEHREKAGQMLSKPSASATPGLPSDCQRS